MAKCAVAPGKRAHLRLSVIVVFQYDASDAGDHKLALSLRDGDGREVDASTGTAEEFPTGGEGMRPFLPEMACLIPAGRYVIRLDLDGEERASWPLDIEEKEGAPGY